MGLWHRGGSSPDELAMLRQQPFQQLEVPTVQIVRRELPLEGRTHRRDRREGHRAGQRLRCEGLGFNAVLKLWRRRRRRGRLRRRGIEGAWRAAEDVVRGRRRRWHPGSFGRRVRGQSASGRGAEVAARRPRRSGSSLGARRRDGAGPRPHRPQRPELEQVVRRQLRLDPLGLLGLLEGRLLRMSW